ncbi:MAG: methylmalonyl Co-A mutase-associated GTPase MeaB [Pseudomonadota bacterium]
MERLATLVHELRLGQRRALAKSITLSESTRADDQAAAQALIAQILPATGKALRIGLSGSPGVGKSTFIETFGGFLIDQGKRVAVLAVDPSSTRTGGSILGDKTRMERLSRDPMAFVRPSPSGGSLGGVARRTREALLMCEAAGYDVVLVETVGVGQSETAVADMVDMFCLLLSPAGVDELQGIKRGIMELADLVIVNKADGEMQTAAKRAQGEYRGALHLMRPKFTGWSPDVLLVSALEGRGLDRVLQNIEDFYAHLDSITALEPLRQAQAEAWMWSEIKDQLMDRFAADRTIAQALPDVTHAVRHGAVPATKAARDLLAAFTQTEA